MTVTVRLSEPVSLTIANGRLEIRRGTRRYGATTATGWWLASGFLAMSGKTVVLRTPMFSRNRWCWLPNRGVCGFYLAEEEEELSWGVVCNGQQGALRWYREALNGKTTDNEPHTLSLEWSAVYNDPELFRYGATS